MTPQSLWLVMFLFNTDMLMANARFPREIRTACLTALERAMS